MLSPYAGKGTKYPQIQRAGLVDILMLSPCPQGVACTFRFIRNARGALLDGRRLEMDAKTLNAKANKAAANFLMRRGYKIIERDWTCPRGDMDIIAWDDDTLVFCEVLPIMGESYVSDVMTDVERAKVEGIALSYVTNLDALDYIVRFDRIQLMILDGSKAMIRHSINRAALA